MSGYGSRSKKGPADVNTGPARPILSFSRGLIGLDHWPYPSSPRNLTDLIWSKDDRTGSWTCDAIHYRSSLEALIDSEIQISDQVPQWRSIHWPKVDLFPPRPEQAEAVESWTNKGQRGLIVMPTGTGKTEVALEIMHRTAVSTLVVSPVRDLMYQWHRRILSGLGYDAGIIGDNTHNLKPVTVTTYDSACIHMQKLGDVFGLIIFDECHHLPGDLRREAALMSAAPLRLGLTATLERADGRHADLMKLIGPLAYEMPLSLARGKTLAEYETIRIPVHLNEDEQRLYDILSDQVREFIYNKRRENKGYTWQDLCAESGSDPEARKVQKAYNAKQAIEDRAAEKLRVLEDIFRLHHGSRTIVFTGTNTMAREVSLRFLIPCLLNHSRKKERLEILDGFAKGDYPAIVANRVLDEGVDIPKAKVAVVLGGRTSASQAIQRLGRVLRRSGNEKAFLYEVVCQNTKEEERSRKRRRTDAYQGTRHRRL